MGGNYEEVFIPELIKDPRFEKNKLIQLEVKEPDLDNMPMIPVMLDEEKGQRARSVANLVGDHEVLGINRTHGEPGFTLRPIRAKIYLKNYYRLVAHCDKIDIYLYMDLIGNRSK